MNGVTRDDLIDVRDQITEEIRRVAAETHGRLDRLNGRIGAVEQTVARHDERITAVASQGKANDASPWKTLKGLLMPLVLAILVLVEVIKMLAAR